MTRGIRAAGRLAWRGPQRAAAGLRSSLNRSPHPPLAWESDLLDDVAFNRPWNLAVKVLRIRARLVHKRLRKDEATVVIVNWNTLDVLRDVLQAVRTFTPSSVDLVVVDNDSTDGSREWLRSQDGLRVIALPANAGHAVALDIATLLARTDIVVTLDSDAVPLTDDWLDPAVVPLLENNAVLAGTRSSRDFVHPMFAAVSVREFARRKLSFQVWRLEGVVPENSVWGEDSWDTGELMTSRLEPGEVVFVERTPNVVDGLPGMTVGGVVYHHGGVTRATESASDDDAHSYHGWRHALEQLLPPEALVGGGSL